MNGALDDYIVSLVLLLLAVVIAFGKGDFLISGYNTASKEKKAKYNIRRLRLLVSSLLVLITIGLVVAALFSSADIVSPFMRNTKDFLSFAIAAVLLVQ